MVPIYYHPYFTYEKAEGQRGGGGGNLIPGLLIPTSFYKFICSLFIF